MLLLSPAQASAAAIVKSPSGQVGPWCVCVMTLNSLTVCNIFSPGTGFSAACHDSCALTAFAMSLPLPRAARLDA